MSNDPTGGNARCPRFVEGGHGSEDGGVGATDDRKSSAGWSARFRRLRWIVGPWQPLTGRGVAAFRVASWGRLIGFQILTAILSAVVLAWVVRRIWFPVVGRGLIHLPPQAEITAGQLNWPNLQPVRLAENVWLDWLITPTNQTDLGQTADLQVEFRPTEFRVNGLAGHLAIPYPDDFTAQLGRIEATARWGAWNWVVLTALALATGLALLILWWSLATLYTLPVLVLAVMLGRRARLFGVWRMSGAALIPGALFANWAILAYGIGAVRLPGFFVLFALHFAVGWAWLVWGLMHCPAAGSREPDNPFELRTKGR